MKKILIAATAAALICAPVAVDAKKKNKAPVDIDAPAGPIRPVSATWPAGVVGGTPSFGASGSLSPNAEVIVRFNSELNSKKAREGTAFTATVAYDVMLGNMIVIPRGTAAYGVVTWRTGKGAFGKSAKMDYEFRSIDLNGQRVPVSGKFHQQGEGNTGAAIGAAVAVGVFGAFVTGRSAIVEAGRESKIYTTQAIPVLAPSIVETKPQ